MRPDFLPAHLELAQDGARRRRTTPAPRSTCARSSRPTARTPRRSSTWASPTRAMGQFDKAMQEYDAAEKLNPNLAAIYLNRGLILHRHKDAPEQGARALQEVHRAGGRRGVPADATPCQGAQGRPRQSSRPSARTTRRPPRRPRRWRRDAEAEAAKAARRSRRKRSRRRAQARRRGDEARRPPPRRRRRQASRRRASTPGRREGRRSEAAKRRGGRRPEEGSKPRIPRSRPTSPPSMSRTSARQRASDGSSGRRAR